MHRQLLALASVAITVAGAGCAATAPHARVARAATAHPADPNAPDASGTWDWMFRSTDDQGDMRVEQEEWHLSQKGLRIEGYYDRAVTMMSVDERLFRCNQRLGFTKTTRVRVAGQIEGDRVMLREVPLFLLDAHVTLIVRRAEHPIPDAADFGAVGIGLLRRCRRA